MRRFTFAFAAILAAGAALRAQAKIEPLLPDQSERKERPGHDKRRFIAPEGFEVVEVAPKDLVGSVVNMTFDHLGRPALAIENGPIVLMLDENNDGVYDKEKPFAPQMKTAHGLCFIGPGDLLANGNGPDGAGLYRLTDTNGDDEADKVEFLAGSKIGGIGEHGPHAIQIGFDGALYVEYGNHSFPDVPVDPASPSRGLQEDQLLERYVDPRGHATNIRAPGGSIHRLDLATNKWSQYCAGFRNAFDFAINERGDLFTFDSDMEWDFGLPWYRPIAVFHCVPGGDYGWRTGSGVAPFYYIDALPPIEGVGRGSPVGVAFYESFAYPAKFYGSLFLGDWSRGRIRVFFPTPSGATYSGESVDFILGEPLNVTDLDIGPDGSLYFSTGGRSTTGGLFRVRYTGAEKPRLAPEELQPIVDQPMHRSAWARFALAEEQKKLGKDWDAKLAAVLNDGNAEPRRRVRALETLAQFGPKPDLKQLEKLAGDENAEIRAAAVLLMGGFPIADSFAPLAKALEDADALVQRRACDSLVWAGLGPDAKIDPKTGPHSRLFALLDSPDRFVRTAARNALVRMDRSLWAESVAGDSLEKRPRGALEGLVAMIQTQALAVDADAVFAKLLEYSSAPMDDDTLLGYLRALQLAFIRDLLPPQPGRAALKAQIGPRLLARYPSKNLSAGRELARMLAYMETPGSIQALLNELTPDKSQEEQIHLAYCLRSVKAGWTRPQRDKFVAWFDHGREIGGAASMEGYIDDIWQSTLANLPKEEKKAAEERKESQLAARRKKAEEMMAQIEGDKKPKVSDLSQMSFQELSDYLEFDPMTYEKGSAERGRVVFNRAKCVNCHIFGAEGKGGGPDLSNVVKRFRRREILEAIMYPSKVISDQYQSTIVDLKNNDTQSGMIAADTDTTLTLITPTGEKIEINKADIAGQRPSTVSIMPEGLLETMTLGDLVDLILFLEKGSGL